MFTNNHTTPTSRFSGWALDDDVENTVLQVNETMTQGIPPMPSTPTRPLSRYTFAVPPPPQSQPIGYYEPPITTSSQPQPQPFMAQPPPITTSSQPQPQPFMAQPPPITTSSQTQTQPFMAQPPPITTSSQPFMAQPPPITTSLQPTHSIVLTPLYKRHYHRGVLETREIDDKSGVREYITIEDIFEYVTLGRTISDNYLDELTKYVVGEVPTTLTTTITDTTFHGRAYNRETPMYSWEKYGLIARCCLEWVLSNPEKIGRGL
jgi:hypothetical protein